MRRIENIMDARRHTVTYEIAGGRRINLDADAVRKFGAAALIRSVGLEPYEKGQEGKRVDVMQRGEKIGTLPASFDPMFAASKSFWYDIRPTDFRREGDKWIACHSICPGDFGSIEGFEPSRDGVTCEPWDEPEVLLRNRDYSTPLE